VSIVSFAPFCIVAKDSFIFKGLFYVFQEL